jgi:hypothetical protein
MPNLTVTKATVLQGDGADKVYLHTDLPSPTPGITNEPLDLYFSVARDKGVDYVVYTLGIDPSLVCLIKRDYFSPSFRNRG